MSPNTADDAGINARPGARGGSYLLAITLLLLVCSVLMNVLLARRVGALRESLLRVKSENRLAAGASVPAIEAKDLDGRPASIAFEAGGRPTVLYVFSPSCGWCAKNLPNVKALASEVSGQYRFIALSLSAHDLRDYLSQQNFDFSVYCEPAAAAVTAYRMGGTPQTVVISADGRVIKNWYGAYSDSTRREVEEYFHVRLPGVARQGAD